MTKRMILPLIFGVAGIAVLLWLGLWQMQRLEWKLGIIDAIETRMAAEPVALAELPQQLSKDVNNYQRVKLNATLTGREMHVLTSIKFKGPGFRVVAEAIWNDQTILVDLGFVLEESKNTPRTGEELQFIGNLIWPNEWDPAFTPEPDLTKNIWFARDLPRMSENFKTAPIMVVMQSATLVDGGEYNDTLPQPVSVNITNDHLQYAITWFSLALVWFGMTLYLLWRIKRKTV
ncbi:SURF1-like protein [Amylibacter ulvae]|uniref:SURF1-like protein n=1 Tax=Paramylibacter ulvae TaxID=1651968 RepID=A0ABQ3D0I6_9RHOB|nr:SURF1 family protein [Amylibacter ulvae]GHA52509.1 SURF1-like protein [Amylibacter ulvae]